MRRSYNKALGEMPNILFEKDLHALQRVDEISHVIIDRRGC